MLAGFLVVIPEIMIAKYRNRIINIHPSLIPSFCGKGYYGLKVHEARAGPGREGDRGYGAFCGRGDGYRPHHSPEGGGGAGRTIRRRLCSARVMEEAEWKILPQAIDLIADGRVSVVDNRVMIEGED